jgi:hypothetical protein
MKRYNWEYNGETMGLIERDNGICVLHSDIKELETERDKALTSRERLRQAIHMGISAGFRRLLGVETERDAALARVEELEKAAKHAIKKLRSHHLCRSGIGAIVAKLEEDINGR